MNFDLCNVYTHLIREVKENNYNGCGRDECRAIRTVNKLDSDMMATDVQDAGVTH